MKIGEVELADSQVEEALKKSGKRLVDETDYLKKSEAANDLAKYRAVTGDNRSLDEIAAIIKQHEENERKNKTHAELLAAEVNKMKLELEKAAKQNEDLKTSVRVRQIGDFFNDVMSAMGVKVIEPILERYKKEFLSLDETKLSREELTSKVGEAITKANEEQMAELQKLGIGGNTQSPEMNVGGGFYNVQSRGGKIAEENPLQAKPYTQEDIINMLKRTSASPLKVPFAIPEQKR